MSLQGKWRIIELPDYDAQYADMIEPAYILFEHSRGEFAFGCVTGAFASGGEHHAVDFKWDGNDEIDEVCGAGWAELQTDGSLIGHRNPLAEFFNSLLGPVGGYCLGLKSGPVDASGPCAREDLS